MMKKLIYSLVLCVAFLSTVKAQDVLLKVEDYITDPNATTVDVPVLVDGFTDLATMQFSLKWDPTVLEFESISDFNLPDMNIDNFNRMNTSGGELGFYWEDTSTSGHSENDGYDIFTIRMNVIGSLYSYSIVSFENFPVAQEIGNSSGLPVAHATQDGKIAIGGMVGTNNAPAKSGQVVISPNPFLERTMVRVTLEQASEVTMQVYNAKGQIILERIKDLTSGQHFLPVESTELPAVGAYFIKIQTNDFTDYRQLIYGQ